MRLGESSQASGTSCPVVCVWTAAVSQGSLEAPLSLGLSGPITLCLTQRMPGEPALPLPIPPPAHPPLPLRSARLVLAVQETEEEPLSPFPVGEHWASGVGSTELGSQHFCWPA